LSGIREATLTGFNRQNILFEIDSSIIEGGCELTLEGGCGVEGRALAESVRIELALGAADDSQYLTEGQP
jgi:hypothetical protein